MNVYRLVLVLALVSWPLISTGRNFLKDVERTVRNTAIAPVGALVQDVVKKQGQVDAATARNDAKQVADAEKELRAAEVALDAEERQIRARVEQRALQRLQDEFPQAKVVLRRIDRATLNAVQNVLYERGFTLQPAVYEGHVFVEADPKTVDDSGLSEVQLHVVLFWPRQGNVINIRYAPLERRLRSPTARIAKETEVIKVASKYVDEIAKSLAPGAKQ